MNIEKETFHETAIYIRTSTSEQNPLNQLKDCESIRPKDQRTDTFVKYTLIEDRQSAWKDIDREGFETLRNLIKFRKLKNLIVWDLDRIYRHRKRLIAFFQFCKIHKCKIYSYRQNWLQQLNQVPEPFNEILHDMMISIMGWMAQDESDKKSMRIKSSVRKSKGKTVSHKGNKWGRKPLSTYKKNKIIELYLAEMKTYRQIALELDLSVGVVHKTIKEFNLKKQQEKHIHKQVD